jgi:hypothetical protein
MPRPESVTHEDIVRWDEQIDQDPDMGLMGTFAIIREVCYAGAWMAEELERLQCPDELIARMQYTGGSMSFGKDPWQIFASLLQQYNNNELEFELEPDAISAQTN